MPKFTELCLRPKTNDSSGNFLLAGIQQVVQDTGLMELTFSVARQRDYAVVHAVKHHQSVLAPASLHPIVTDLCRTVVHYSASRKPMLMILDEFDLFF